MGDVCPVNGDARAGEAFVGKAGAVVAVPVVPGTPVGNLPPVSDAMKACCWELSKKGIFDGVVTSFCVLNC